jgi:DNA-binding response OmpR family regulator
MSVSQRVLVVEDEGRVSRFLVERLAQEGFAVEDCSSFVEFQKKLTESKVDDYALLVLDRMLGQKDSEKLVPEVRVRWPNTKVLILSALSSTEEKVRLLNLGADDYMGKPFSMDELVARLRVLLRRERQSDGVKSHLGLGDLSVDLLGHVAHVGSLKLELTKKEFQLLVTFLKTPGRVYSKFQLMDMVWETQAEIESNVVEVTINNLRRKLEVTKTKAKILSKRHVGYWIET